MKAEAGSLFSTNKLLPFWTGLSATPKGFEDSNAMALVIPLFRGNFGEGGMSMTCVAPSQFGYDRTQNLKVQKKDINPFMPGGLFYPCKSDTSISNFRGAWSVLFIFYGHS